MDAKYKKHRLLCQNQNVGLSLPTHDLGMFFTMRQIYKPCTQFLILLFNNASDINI